MSRTRIVVLSVIGLFVVMQIIPLDRSNPPVELEVPAPREVIEVLERSCFDCHSNKTHWPWYAYVAPVSFLITDDVHHAREHMNMSAWNLYDEEKREELYKEIWEEVEEGHMPLPIYLFLHPDAELDAESLERLRVWSESMSGSDH